MQPGQNVDPGDVSPTFTTTVLEATRTEIPTLPEVKGAVVSKDSEFAYRDRVQSPFESGNAAFFCNTKTSDPTGLELFSIALRCQQTAVKEEINVVREYA